MSITQFTNLADLWCSALAPENPTKRKRADSQYNHSGHNLETPEPNSDQDVLVDVHLKAHTKGPTRQHTIPSSSDPEDLVDIHPKARAKGPIHPHVIPSGPHNRHSSLVQSSQVVTSIVIVVYKLMCHSTLNSNVLPLQPTEAQNLEMT